MPHQNPKPRSHSAFRNVRSKVDTSQPKSFSQRSSSLNRKKEKKPVIVPISLSPNSSKKQQKEKMKMDSTATTTTIAKTKTKKIRTDKSKAQIASTHQTNDKKESPEVKARKRPSSIPLMTVKHDIANTNQQWGNEVENRRDVDQTIEDDPKSHISIDGKAPIKDEDEELKNTAEFKISPNEKIVGNDIDHADSNDFDNDPNIEADKFATIESNPEELSLDIMNAVENEPLTDEITDETPRDIGPPAPTLELEAEPVPATPDSYEVTGLRKSTSDLAIVADEPSTDEAKEQSMGEDTQLPQSITGDEIDEIIDEDVAYTESAVLNQKGSIDENTATDVYADNGKPKNETSEYFPDFNHSPMEIETEPVYLNSLDKSHEGSSSEDIQQQLGNELPDSAFLQSLTQNIGKPEYLTTTIFEENEEKIPTSDDEQQIDEFERENSENVISEFEFTKFEASADENEVVENVSQADDDEDKDEFAKRKSSIIKVDAVTKLLERCFQLHSPSEEDPENETTESSLQFENLTNQGTIKNKTDTGAEEASDEECKMWTYTTDEIQQFQTLKNTENDTEENGDDDTQRKKCLNTGSVTDAIDNEYENNFFAEGSTTVIRKSTNSTSPNQLNDFQVTTNPVADERDSFVNMAVLTNDRTLYNPYGEADDHLVPGNVKEAWSDEIRSPADGNPGICPDRNAGDGLETPDDAEPKRNYVYDSSTDSESDNDQYQVWRNVNNVFAELNEQNRRVSGHSMSPFESESDDDSVIKTTVPSQKLHSLNINNNNDGQHAKAVRAKNSTKKSQEKEPQVGDTKAARGRIRSRNLDRPIYVDLTYVPDTSPDKLVEFSNLIRAKTYVLSSECATREMFSKVLFGIRKWAGVDVETTIVSLGNETDADQWSIEYADILQEANCIVVTSGQVLVDGQAVKACKIDLSCNSE